MRRSLPRARRWTRRPPLRERLDDASNEPAHSTAPSTLAGESARGVAERVLRAPDFHAVAAPIAALGTHRPAWHSRASGLTVGALARWHVALAPPLVAAKHVIGGRHAKRRQS